MTRRRRLMFGLTAIAIAVGSFRFTMKDYSYLRYDLALLHEGYNDLMGDPRAGRVEH